MGKDKVQKTEMHEKTEVIVTIAVDLVLIAGYIFLPETGIGGMVKEASGAVLILSWGILFLVGGIRKRKDLKRYWETDCMRRIRKNGKEELRECYEDGKLFTRNFW